MPFVRAREGHAVCRTRFSRRQLTHEPGGPGRRRTRAIGPRRDDLAVAVGLEPSTTPRRRRAGAAAAAPDGVGPHPRTARREDSRTTLAVSLETTGTVDVPTIASLLGDSALATGPGRPGEPGLSRPCPEPAGWRGGIPVRQPARLGGHRCCLSAYDSHPLPHSAHFVPAAQPARQR